MNIKQAASRLYQFILDDPELNSFIDDLTRASLRRDRIDDDDDQWYQTKGDHIVTLLSTAQNIGR